MRFSPIRLEAQVALSERPALVAAAEMLSASLGAAAGSGPWGVALNFWEPEAEIAGLDAPDAVILSMVADAERTDELIEVTSARWRERLARLAEAGAPILICTVLRHVPGREGAGAPSALLERILRLNMMAIELSHDLDLQVVDIDRALAHIGAHALGTDFRLGGGPAAEVAGHAIAWSLLALDNIAGWELEDAARAHLGDFDHIDDLIARRHGATAAGAGIG